MMFELENIQPGQMVIYHTGNVQTLQALCGAKSTQPAKIANKLFLNGKCELVQRKIGVNSYGHGQYEYIAIGKYDQRPMHNAWTSFKGENTSGKHDER